MTGFSRSSAKASGAAKAIRERWKNGMLYIIAVNAHLLEGDRNRCIETWTDDYYQRAREYGRAC
jgi:hypothetical protein